MKTGQTVASTTTDPKAWMTKIYPTEAVMTTWTMKTDLTEAVMTTDPKAWTMKIYLTKTDQTA